MESNSFLSSPANCNHEPPLDLVIIKSILLAAQNTRIYCPSGFNIVPVELRAENILFLCLLIIRDSNRINGMGSKLVVMSCGSSTHNESFLSDFLMFLKKYI